MSRQTSLITSSAPVGNRPASSSPASGAPCSATSPGTKNVAGITTSIAYTFENRRAAVRSFATPFCVQTTAISCPAASSKSSSAACVSCPFIVSSTTSSGRKSISDGCPAVCTSTFTTPSGRRTVSPCSRIAVRCSPRATRIASRPACVSSAPIPPPIPPAP